MTSSERRCPAIPGAVQELFAPLPEPVQSLALAARRLLLVVLPGALELPDKKAKVLGYGYGRGYKDIVATLMLSKKGLKIGLVHSASFTDPARLLEGAGKVHRHIVIRDAEDLRRAAVRELIEVALRAWRQRANAHKH